jgi:hypothetical protein
MMDSLQSFQQNVGPLAAFLIPLVAGFVGGAGLTYFAHRRHPAGDAASGEDGPRETNSMTDDMVIKWETKDLRRSPRRNGKIVEVLVSLPGETDFPHQGLVMNRSNGGLGILVGSEFKVGAVLGVLPSEASKLTPWVEVEVKSCRKHPEGFELGLQYIKVPPYSTLVLFG